MKSFHKIVSEVAEPKAGDEKHFKDKHVVTKVDYPVDVEAQFTGGKIVKAPKRKADYDKGEDEIVYEETFIIPEEILATEKNAFHTAAANAHKSGAKHFAFGGKKYPVTMSKDAASTFAGKGSMKKEAMDPVGKEDGDIDNDGDKDSSDKYLQARRDAIGKAMKKEGAEGEDHEVSMATKTLDSIIRHATELKGKLGMDEKDIPAWIQDHIAVAENNLDQANTSYHEYGQKEQPASDAGAM